MSGETWPTNADEIRVDDVAEDAVQRAVDVLGLCRR
jgi:hypothetical protein